MMIILKGQNKNIYLFIDDIQSINKYIILY